MPSATRIRTMMFLGEDRVNGEECNHYQITDSERTTSFGYIHRGYVTYGYQSVGESKRAFRECVAAISSPPDDWQQEIDDVV